MFIEVGLWYLFIVYFGFLLIVGYWYNDMSGFIDQVIVLVESEGCLCQIVQYGNFVYGFQCYMEFIVEMVEGLI